MDKNNSRIGNPQDNTQSQSQSLPSRYITVNNISGEISDQMQAPSIKNIVLEGGSVRGLALTGALKSLERLGKLKDLKRVAGSSAGGLTALPLALGYTADEIEKIIGNMNIAKLMDIDSLEIAHQGEELAAIIMRSLKKGSNIDKAFKEALQDKFGDVAVGILKTLSKFGFAPSKLFKRHIEKTAINLENPILQEQIATYCGGIINFFKGREGKGLFDGEQILIIMREIISHKIKQAIEKHPQLESLNIDPNHVTFGQLQKISSSYPDLGLRSLALTGTNYTRQRLEIFSAETTPDMEIGIATRITMSIPWLFKTVKYNNDDYMDGGCLNNFPIEIFDKPPYTSITGPLFKGEYGQNLETLGIRIDDKEEMRYVLWEKKPALTSTQQIMERIAHHTKDLFIGVDNSQAEKNILTRTYEYSQRILQLYDNDIDFLNFYLSDEDKKQLLKNGEDAANEWCDNHDKELLPENKYSDYIQFISNLNFEQLGLFCEDIKNEAKTAFTIINESADYTKKVRFALADYATSLYDLMSQQIMDLNFVANSKRISAELLQKEVMKTPKVGSNDAAFFSSQSVNDASFTDRSPKRKTL